MTTLKELFEKYGYLTDIKFKTDKKFLVPLDHLEITSWGPMGEGVLPKNNKCYCDNCKKSEINYVHNYLHKDTNAFTYPDVLNLEVDVSSFYCDTFPANLETSPKLSEQQIANMFYFRIMEANGYKLCDCEFCQLNIETLKNNNYLVCKETNEMIFAKYVDIEDFNAQCELYDEHREELFIKQVKDSVDPELWVDNDLVQTVQNFNNKLKDIEEQNRVASFNNYEKFNYHNNYEPYLNYLLEENEKSYKLSSDFKHYFETKIVCIYNNFKKNKNTYKKNYAIKANNDTELVHKYFTKFIPKTEMDPKYVFKILILEMMEYKKEITFKEITKHIVDYLKEGTTLIEEIL
jgi:hypothetical protein